MEYPKPSPRPKKPRKPMKRFSDKRAKLERQKTATYKAMKDTKANHCHGCGAKNYEHSHRISQKENKWTADAGNIDLFCRYCHIAYESGRVYQLDNGDEVMQWLKENSYEHFMRKAFQMRDRIVEDEVNVDELAPYVLKILIELNPEQ